MAAHCLLALALLLVCCMPLDKSLNIFSITMEVMAPMTLQGCCENLIGQWIWKNLNCKMHPVLINYDYRWLLWSRPYIPTSAALCLCYRVQTILALACCSSLFPTSTTLLGPQGSHLLEFASYIFIPEPLLLLSPIRMQCLPPSVYLLTYRFRQHFPCDFFF